MKGLHPNAVKLRDVSVKYVVIVANAAIHYEVFTGFKMDTGLRRYDETSKLNGIGLHPERKDTPKAAGYREAAVVAA